MTMELIERLELIAAWRKPGGPTPKLPQPNTHTTCTEAAAEILSLRARVAELEGDLDMLQMREAAYRSAHDLHGGGSMKAGSAWDAMRRAGDRARATLSKGEA